MKAAASRAIAPTVLATLRQNALLVELSHQCQDLEGQCDVMDREIAWALQLDYIPSFTGSLDASLAYIRKHFPQPEWKYGFQDAGYLGYTGPLVWLRNTGCPREGFDNKPNANFRYHDRSARTIENAFAATILLAESFRR